MTNESGGDQPPEKMSTDDDDKVSDSNNTQPPQQIQENRARVIDFENKYKPTDAGPYFVYVEHKEKNVGRLFPVRIGHYLTVSEMFKKTIVDIKPVGINRVKVVLNSYRAANDLVNNQLLVKNNYISYIPKFYTQRKGVVKMVDTFFAEDYLLNTIECDKKVLEVKRMKRRSVDQDGNEKLVDRQIIIVSFLGATLPQNLRINSVNFPVEPYIYPVVQCLKCMRYGHVKNQCRSTAEVCKKCGDEHSSETCSNDYRYCIVCKDSGHSSISRDCPNYQKQKRIKEIMSKRNLSFKEAELIERNPSYAKVTINNRFQALSDLENFPPLPTTTDSYNNRMPNTRSQLTYIPERNMNPHTSKIQTGRSTHTRSQTHNQINQQYKKRKASKSPTDKNSENVYTVIPNPHRSDFIEYKEKVSQLLTTFVTELLTNILPQDKSADIVWEQLKIRENISCLVKHLGDEQINDQNDSNDEYEFY